MHLLSYPLSSSTPMYGGGPGPRITPQKSLTQGDSCNTYDLSLNNHCGTHVDLPRHFCASGKTLTELPVTFWRCHSPLVMQLPTPPPRGHIFDGSLLDAMIPNDCVDMFILRTGYWRIRGQNGYWQDPPGFAPDLAENLREKFPKIRFFGFDLISLSSFAHRDLGRAAHRAFLCHGQPICILEDMDLSRDCEIQQVLVSPLLVEGLDGGPCTIWANIE